MSDGETAGAPPLHLEAVHKTFVQGDRRLEILKDATLTINKGEMVALLGPSGAGKSTLLHIAGLLETPDEGRIEIGGRAAGALGDGERTALRRRAIGFVYQHHHLLPEFSALENLVVPQMIAGLDRKTAAERGRELLETVGLTQRADHRPGKLSGGEQQRVALVRALCNRPQLLLADEPTGNLDPETSDSVFDLLVRLVHGVGVGALIATHNLELAGRMDRVLRLQDGQVVEDAG